MSRSSQQRGRRSASLLSFAVALTLVGNALGQEWTYRVLDQEDPLHAPFVFVPLFGAPPSGVTVQVPVNAKNPRFGQFRYGGPDSPRIAVLLDAPEDRMARLYVDANRDRVLDLSDFVAGSASEWELPLSVEIREGDRVHSQRRVHRFRLSPKAQVLSRADGGCVEGPLDLAGETSVALRVDVNGNGLLSDQEDRLFWDQDGDGAFDPLSEIHGWRSVVWLRDVRYTLRSDGLGTSLGAKPLIGIGRISLAIPSTVKESARNGATIAATLSSREGVTILIQKFEDAVEVPAGSWRLHDVRLTLPSEELPWTYVFTSTADAASARWHEVRRDGGIRLDPLEGLTLASKLSGAPEARTIVVSPRLTTRDHLSITTCYVGNDQGFLGGNTAVVHVLDRQGRTVASTGSGFA